MNKERIKVVDCTIRDGIGSGLKLGIMIDAHRVKEQQYGHLYGE
jgi:hypothetical protein